MKLRLLVTDRCEKECIGCCNNDWNLNHIPTFNINDFYELIMITGGEPFLFNEELEVLIKKIKTIHKETKITIYTSDVRNLSIVIPILNISDGMTLTIHNEEDIASFLVFQEYLAVRKYIEKTLFLNVIPSREINSLISINPSIWHRIKFGEWIKNCPLPKNEDFQRLDILWK